MSKKNVLAFCVLGLVTSLFAGNLMIDSHEIPTVIGTYGRYAQNVSVFTWTPFDTTRTHWDLTGYQGGRTARVRLADWTTGRTPAPESMQTDPPDPSIMEIDTLGSGSVQWVYEDKDSFGLYIDGIDFTQSEFRFIGNYIPDATVYATPMYYRSSWASAVTWQYEIIQGIPYVATEQHTKLIVGKGKVKVPMSGDYYWPCLVIRDYMVFTDNLGTEDRRWIYEWCVPGHFSGANGVAAALSQNGAAKDFINVETFMQLSSLTVPGQDLLPPQFMETRTWTDTSFAGPFDVYTVIQDNDSVAEESLFYRINEAEWVGSAPDSNRADTFYFTIPEVSTTSRIDYYVWARDEYSKDNNIDFWTTWPVCSPESTMITFNVDLTGVSGVEPNQLGRVGLSASPNPFGGTTTFYFAHATAPSAAIQVYSTSGELVNTLDMGRVPGLGFQVQWDGRDESGNLVPAGTYLYRVKGAGYAETQKVTLTR